MAELAVTDGMPPPADLPDGACITTRLDDGRLRIDRADPRILISAELLVEIYVAPMIGVSLAPEWPYRYPPVHADGFWEGALLKVCGVDRSVVYRIGEYVPRIRAYIAEWPD
jgi:hypothetical protein